MLGFRDAIGVAMLTVAVVSSSSAQSEKKPKDQGEYDIYNQVSKENNNPAKQLEHLDTWTQKYPSSDFIDERLFFYISAYNGTNQPAKVLDVAARLLAKDLNAAFKDPRQVIAVLYMAALNFQKITDPTAEQSASGEKAARDLLGFTPQYFTAANKPPATSDADWAKARNDLDTVAKSALVYAAMLPGNRALAPNPKDPARCASAEAAYMKGLEQHPESAQIAYALAGAMRCQQTVRADKIPHAIYQYARAAVLDPAKGGFTDPKTRENVDNYLRTIYRQYHGGDDGLDELKRLAARSPLPPPGFTLKSSSEIAAEKEEQFAKTNPQLALWMGIRKQLTDAYGEQYFEAQLKDAAIPKLKGRLVEAKPACRSKELLVAISDSSQPEVSLKLDTALTGIPQTGAEIQWEGVASMFTKDPFLLTMDTEKAKIENLAVLPCTTKKKR